MKNIIAAHAAVSRAQFQLRMAIQKKFPVGCTISVTLGRATVIATVESYGDDHCAGQLYCRNQRTGKLRTCYVLYDKPQRIGNVSWGRK